MYEFTEQRLNVRRWVLIVEDEEVNRQMLSKIVGTRYEVFCAANGREALQFIRLNCQKLSLVLLDLMMPEMNGYELLELLRMDQDLKRIPVIVLTSERDAEVKSLRLGAVDFIPKPYDNPDVIMARVRRSIELSEDSSIIGATQNDSLTGLFNREYFFEYAQVHDTYYPEMPMNALVLNVNRFHLLNEMNGKAFGDDVLLRIAERIRQLVRKEHGIACRVGADIFYIYLPSIVQPIEILDHVAEGLSELLENASSRLRLGVYPVSDLSMEMERRFDCALHACNSIRNSYSSQTAWYDEEMHRKETHAERLISDMDKSLAEGEFKVYYQPKFDIQGEESVLQSAEALIRWQHPELGMVRPDEFIPLFEQNGLVHKLDRYVWHEVGRQIAAWRDAYNIVIPVSVNVSRIDILEKGFVEEIVQIVEENGLVPADYHLEVTESAYTEDKGKIVEIVNDLRERGFKVEMDDFGSGYSSLNMLSSMPIDALKLDMGFIRNIHKNQKDYRMVELMMDIAEFLKVPVIAEGVEQEEQYQLLKQAGCDVIQGYYFAKPVPPEEFEEFIKTRVEQRSQIPFEAAQRASYGIGIRSE